jgi:hypothetical protein
VESRKLKEEEEEVFAHRRRGAEGRRGREILNVGFFDWAWRLESAATGRKVRRWWGWVNKKLLN